MNDPLANGCPDCSGYGYDLLACDSPGHHAWEVQRSDACDCLDDRAGEHGRATDDTAAVAFVRDLEAGLPFALERARRLVDSAEDGHEEEG